MSQHDQSAQQTIARPGLWRHLLAMLYDTFLLLPLFMASSFVLVAAFGATEDISQPTVPVWVTRISWPLILTIFFGLFWRKSGQTLGMQAWRIKLVSKSGERITWRTVITRVFAAALSAAPGGLGYWWALWDRDRMTWHDRISQTQLVLLPKRKK